MITVDDYRVDTAGQENIDVWPMRLDVKHVVMCRIRREDTEVVREGTGRKSGFDEYAVNDGLIMTDAVVRSLNFFGCKGLFSRRRQF